MGSRGGAKEAVMDSCYLCEIGKQGLIIPTPIGDRLICDKCVLACIFSHPKMEFLRT